MKLKQSNSKYSDYRDVITSITRDKDFRTIEMQDFPAYRYYELWKRDFLTSDQRAERRQYRSGVRAKANADYQEQLKAIEKEKRLLARHQRAEARKPKKKEKAERKSPITHSELLQEAEPISIKQLPDGSHVIMLNPKTRITTKPGKDPQQVIDKYRNRNTYECKNYK